MDSCDFSLVCAASLEHECAGQEEEVGVPKAICLQTLNHLPRERRLFNGGVRCGEWLSVRGERWQRRTRDVRPYTSDICSLIEVLCYTECNLCVHACIRSNAVRACPACASTHETRHSLIHSFTG